MGWGRPRRPALLAAGVAALPACGCFALTSKYVGEAHTRCSTLVLYSVLRTDRIHALCEVYGSPRSCEELDRPFLTDGSVCVRALHRARLETVAHGYDTAPPFPALRCCDPFFLALPFHGRNQRRSQFSDISFAVCFRPTPENI